jgi:hypothetical protein
MDYEITVTAEAASIGLASLRNWLRQGVIQHCGQEPRPSHPRMFPLAGVYEIALLRQMTVHGIERSLAVRIVRGEIGKWLAADDPDTPELLCMAYRQTARIMTEYRDVARPAVLVVGVDDSDPDNPVPAETQCAQGWDDVQRTIGCVRSAGKPYLLKSQPPGGMNEAQPGAPFTVIHVVEITSVLAAVDARLGQER